MELKKWNYKKHEYEPYKVPDNWNVKVYSNNLDEIIKCPHCGRKIKIGDGYASEEIHTDIGIGYMVCEKCHQKEWIRSGRSWG